jgi:hypothetical protein
MVPATKQFPPSPVTPAPIDVINLSPPAEFVKRDFVFWSDTNWYRFPHSVW